MGIFDAEVDLYKTWTATLQFRGWLVGGQPKEPKALREMLIRKADLADTAQLLRAELTRLAREYEVEITQDMPLDEIEKLVEAKATKTGNGFWSDDNGLYIGAYQVKSMFKEACNIIYAGQRWGKTAKGAKSYLSERLFISPERISLDRTEPDGVLIKTGVVSGQSGKRSIMTQAEYVIRPRISFDVKITKDSDDLLAAIPKLWVTMQDEGLGAMRSSGHGTFDLIAWKPQRALRQVEKVA